MSKRPADERTPGQGQADLFGAAAAETWQSRTRPSPGAPSRFAQTRSKAALSPDRDGASENAVHGLLNVRQAAARLGLSKSTLDKMRCAGKGPRFIKSTDRAVRYDPLDLKAWIEARRRNST